MIKYAQWRPPLPQTMIGWTIVVGCSSNQVLGKSPFWVLFPSLSNLSYDVANALYLDAFSLKVNYVDLLYGVSPLHFGL